MKKLINSKYLSTIIFILSIIVIVKIIWIAVSLLFLPTSGEEYQQPNRIKKLYYRVRLTNKTKEIVDAIKPIKNSRMTEVSSMKGYKLLGLYKSKDTIVVTVEKGRKTTVLIKGEEINGFVLTSAGRDYAIFKKSGEEFKLSLTNNTKALSKIAKHSRTKRPSLKAKSTIVEDGGVKHIPRTLLTSYTKDMDKIWKDIAIVKHQTNGKLDGYKVNYVKKGSDFEKLGLKRGDILVEINAEPLNSLSAAMNFFKEINSIENLTLTVIRNGKREDIEYEIQ